MLVAGKALGLTKSLVGRNGFQLRTSVISGPARVKVSKGVCTNYSEKLIQPKFMHTLFPILLSQFFYLQIFLNVQIKITFSLQEMALFGLLIAGGVSFFPAWVLVHIPVYRGGAAE